ncbi:MAG: transmembrane sensor [Paraglaciecola sp.]|jgi:transmembrane sensor
MSNVYQLSSSDKCIDQASQWIAKIDRGLSQQETAEYQQWMAASEGNRDALADMAKMWDKMDALERLADLFPHSPQHKYTSSMRYLALAASFALAIVLGYSVWQSDFLNENQLLVQQVISENTYSTKIGEQSTFYLQDKTKVVLNTNSKVSVTYTDKQRVFELERGEMHVTVAHNSEQPLSVYAGGRIIQAVGTAFNVEILDNEVELIVTEGKVLVAEHRSEQSSPLQVKSVYLPKNSLAVAKGQKIALGSLSEQVLHLKTADIQANLSWQQGDLIFRGESLEKVMQEVGRYTHYKFVFADENLKKIQVAGLFKTDDINVLLEALSRNFNIQHQRVSPDKIQLSLLVDEV